MSRITAQLFDVDNLTYIMDLPSSYDRTVANLANQVATGAVSLPLVSSAEVAAMTRNRYVRFLLDGNYVWAGRIRQRRQESVVAGEEGATNRSFALVGPASEFAQSILLPPFGTDAFPTMTNRPFGWMSLEGIIRGGLWGLASNVRTLFNDNTPLAFPYIFCWRIWGHPTARIADGTDYFRFDFTLASATTVVFYVSAADNFDMYLNGAGVMTGDDAPGTSSDRTWRCVAALPAGNHCVAFRVHNNTTTDAWLACSAFQCNPDGVTGALQLGTFIFTTGFEAGGTTLYDFRSQQYPADPIGVTVGMVISAMLTEAQARGRLLDWGVNFSDDVDSNGNAWDNISEVELPVGGSISDCLIKLAAVYCDFSVNVVGKTLNAYRWREMGNFAGAAGTSGTQPVFSSALFGGNPGVRLSNILELVHQEPADA